MADLIAERIIAITRGADLERTLSAYFGQEVSGLVNKEHESQVACLQGLIACFPLLGGQGRCCGVGRESLRLVACGAQHVVQGVFYCTSVNIRNLLSVRTGGRGAAHRWVQANSS